MRALADSPECQPYGVKTNLSLEIRCRNASGHQELPRDEGAVYDVVEAERRAQREGGRLEDEGLDGKGHRGR